MTKFMTILSLVLSLSPFSWGAREVQNGGGGWVSKDQYMTFYSARLPVIPTSLALSEVPGLNLLLENISALSISASYKSKILALVFPLGERAYYRVDNSRFDASILKDLRAKYSLMMKIPEDNVALFAITDSRLQTTFLLPEFFHLKPAEQAAILFHESLWLLDFDLDYQRVISAEQAAQAFFENKQNAHNIQNFYTQLSQLLGDSRILLVPSLQKDIQSGALPEKIKVQDLLGDSYLQCLLDPLQGAVDIVYRARNCARGLLSHLIVLTAKYPSSIFIPALAHYFQGGGVLTIPERRSLAEVSAGAFSLEDLQESSGAYIWRLKSSAGASVGLFYFH